MATAPVMKSSHRGRGALWNGGIVVLAIGVLGVAVWAAVAAFSASYGTVPTTPDGPIETVGVEDPQNAPDLWTGRTGGDHGPIIWEGTAAEYRALEAEASAAEQASLRRTLLHPSAAVALLGVTMLVIARRHHLRAASEERR